ncbi:excinuclease ABC subunit C, partial [Candidatus Woesearchaeota archaeon]
KEMPDLIVVDGGQGHLNAGIKALLRAGARIAIISLAKKEETIHLPGGVTLNPDKNSPEMLLLRGIRDRTHNFAVRYNRKRREIEFKQDKKDI